MLVNYFIKIYWETLGFANWILLLGIRLLFPLAYWHELFSPCMSREAYYLLVSCYFFQLWNFAWYFHNITFYACTVMMFFNEELSYAWACCVVATRLKPKSRFVQNFASLSCRITTAVSFLTGTNHHYLLVPSHARAHTHPPTPSLKMEDENRKSNYAS